MSLQFPIHWAPVVAGIVALVVCVFLVVRLVPAAAGEAMILVCVPVGGLVIGLIGTGLTGEVSLSILVGCGVGILVFPLTALFDT